jgi:hypothetical protein
VATGSDATTAIRHGGHSGQWGLSALLLGALVIILFPMMTALILAVLIGAWEIDAVKSHHIDFAIIATRVLVYGLLSLGVLALISGVFGLVSAARRRQPFGLSLTGTTAALIAIAVAVVLVQIGNYAIEDTHRLRSEHRRFRPASPALVQEVVAAVERYPQLKPEWDEAMADGVVTEAEAEAILVHAGVRHVAPR